MYIKTRRRRGLRLGTLLNDSYRECFIIFSSISSPGLKGDSFWGVFFGIFGDLEGLAGRRLFSGKYNEY